MTTRRNLPAGFVVPAQPIEQHQPPAGGNWVHEIKHDGYRLIVRKEGAGVCLLPPQEIPHRLFSIPAGRQHQAQPREANRAGSAGAF
jgi:hypothetical protein